MATNEKVQIDYLHQKTYSENALNVIGATTDIALRTVTAYDDTTCKHVRKFGIDFTVGDITDAVIEHPHSAGGNAWTFDFQGWNGSAWVSMGSVKDTGGASAAFSDGAEFAATKLKIVITPDAGDTISITDGDHITLSFDATTVSIMLSGESMTAAYTVYCSRTGSTYYDTALMYGGKRHTPTGTAALPYFTITAALAALGAAFVTVTVLDSMTYDEELTISGAYTLQAALGQTPTITAGIGARATREVAHDGNNNDTCYVAKTGNDGTGTGKWWAPYLTIGAAYTGIGARTYINIMDSGTYDEYVTITTAITLESIYGFVPTCVAKSVSNFILRIEHNANIYGIIYDGEVIKSIAVSIQYNNYTGTIKNCTFKNISGVISSMFGAIVFNEDAAGAAGNINFTGNILYNYFYDILQNGISIYNRGNAAGQISFNYFNNVCQPHGEVNSGAIYFLDRVAPGGFTITTHILNNTMYMCGSDSQYNPAIFIISYSHFDGNIQNNTIYKNNNTNVDHGGVGTLLRHDSAFAYGGTFQNNIIRGAVDYDLSGNNLTVTYTNYSTNSGITIGAGCITTDPSFISSDKITLPPNSTSYKTGTSESDMGIIWGSILISSSTVTINGFIIDGQNQYNHAIYKTGATDYTALTVKWCTIKNYQGIAIDDYSGAATNSIMSNNIVYNNGVGINYRKNGNTADSNIIYSNTLYGIYSDYTTQTFGHNIFYLNQYGIYLASNSFGIVIVNSIFMQNSLYRIYSAVSVSISYCDIVDAYNSNVTIVPASTYYNITDNPLFVSTVSGSEDFHIKTIYAGYSLTSPCYNAASDGYDIGAYLIARTIATEGWKTHQFTYNPLTLDESYVAMGRTQFETALGNVKQWQKSQKRKYAMKWGNMQAMNQTDREKLFYWVSLVQSRENQRTDDESRFRLHFLPSQKELVDSGGVVSATNKTLTDSGSTWVEDAWKGFYVSIKSASGTTNMDTDSGAKTATRAAAGWTVNAWAGYYLNIMIGTKTFYFYIISNSATVLTVSDPNGYLTTAANITWSIVKNYRIASNTATVLTLEDDDAELVAGTYDYYIDFIICRCVSSAQSYNQPRYYRQKETWKMGAEIEYIEE